MSNPIEGSLHSRVKTLSKDNPSITVGQAWFILEKEFPDDNPKWLRLKIGEYIHKFRKHKPENSTESPGAEIQKLLLQLNEIGTSSGGGLPINDIEKNFEMHNLVLDFLKFCNELPVFS